MSPGHWLVNFGNSLSAIVTLNVRVSMLPLKVGLVQANCLPALSTAVQVTVVVFERFTSRGLRHDQDRVPVKLKAGTNTILLKLYQDTLGWEFCGADRHPRRPAPRFRPEDGLTAGNRGSPGGRGWGGEDLGLTESFLSFRRTGYLLRTIVSSSRPLPFPPLRRTSSF